jgi:hypothetical protein
MADPAAGEEMQVSTCLRPMMSLVLVDTEQHYCHLRPYVEAVVLALFLPALVSWECSYIATTKRSEYEIRKMDFDDFTHEPSAAVGSRRRKKPSSRVILSNAKDLLCVFSIKYSRCFAALLRNTP